MRAVYLFKFKLFQFPIDNELFANQTVNRNCGKIFSSCFRVVGLKPVPVNCIQFTTI